MSFCMSVSAPPTLPLWGKPARLQSPVYPLGQSELKPPCHPRVLAEGPKGAEPSPISEAVAKASGTRERYKGAAWQERGRETWSGCSWEGRAHTLDCHRRGSKSFTH